MLELSRGLPSRVLGALAALERRTLAVDGGRLKLEWDTLRARTGAEVEDVLWWDGDTLLGFVGLYAFGGTNVELVGMVDPAARRRGIASALLDAALPLVRARSSEPALLVVPRDAAGGQAFARARGAVLSHSEHALVQREAPPPGRRDPAVEVRAATSADLPAVARLLAEAFGVSLDTTRVRLDSEYERTLVVTERDEVLGTVRITRGGDAGGDAGGTGGDAGGVYGFVIDARHRGRGLGRDVLRRVCQQLRDEGATRVGLEVAVQNESALGLYTSLGFERVTTEDYFALGHGARPGP